jgi:hypothetical protein
MSVVSVKVSEAIKKDMEKRKEKINWSEEIRSFIQQKLEEERRRENVERAKKVIEQMRGVPRGTAARLVREDRDSHN